jgi:hypothetical protein
LLGGPLQTPIHGAQQFPNVPRVKLHTGHALDHRGHARQRPKVRSETVGLRSLAETAVDFAELLHIQLRFPAGTPRPPHPTGLMLSPSLVPAAHTLTSYFQFPCNRRQDQFTGREQTSGTLAAQFHGMEIAPRGSRHNSIMRPADTNVTIFREIMSLYYARLSRTFSSSHRPRSLSGIDHPSPGY